jgi:hypothetical protein
MYACLIVMLGLVVWPMKPGLLKVIKEMGIGEGTAHRGVVWR